MQHDRTKCQNRHQCRDKASLPFGLDFPSQERRLTRHVSGVGNVKMAVDGRRMRALRALRAHGNGHGGRSASGYRGGIPRGRRNRCDGAKTRAIAVGGAAGRHCVGWRRALPTWDYQFGGTWRRSTQSANQQPVWVDPAELLLARRQRGQRIQLQSGIADRRVHRRCVHCRAYQSRHGTIRFGSSRGVARPAGHLVRPQHHGRCDQFHHAQPVADR